VTDGIVGTEKQCIGLAERVGLPFQVNRIEVRAPWRWLPPQAWINPLAALGAGGDRLAPPWPDLLIASGRKAAAPSIAVRKAAAGRTFTVQVQNPVVALDRFDLVVAPRHDRLEGRNVVSTTGSLHGLTPAVLARAAERFAGEVAGMAHPRVLVLVGGANKVYRFGVGEAAALAKALAALPGSLLVTTSRRTGDEQAATLIAGLPADRTIVWDGTGDNPYPGWLGLADAVVVTGDSVNMVTEACAAGRPVYVVALPGGSAKFRAFHALMRTDGHTRPFEGRLEDWTPTPLDDTREVADIIRDKLRARGIDV
jgi:mitochondrial fission protein ELM1